MSSTKHIVFIVPGFAKDEDDFLCAPPLQQLVLELRKSNTVEISILAIHYPYAPKKYTWNGVNVVSLGGDNARGWRKLKFYRKAISFLTELNRVHPIDAVHSFWLSDASLVGTRWSKRNGKSHFITLMGQEAETASKYRRFIRAEDQIVALSTEQKKRIQDQLKLAVNHVIPFGITKVSLNETERTTDILGVGSLIEVKNYKQFIDTVAQLQMKSSLVVKLIGDGPLRKELERYALEKNADIDFIGIIDRKEVLVEMSRAKVLFHPSNSESLGYVFLEGLMCGMGIVSKSVGIAGDLSSQSWSLVSDGNYEIEIQKQLLLNSTRKPEVPLTISNTSRHYLDLWRIE